jgi:DNA-binding GntR family transcriptional regulator
MNNWTTLETRTLRENVTDLIREAIIEGNLPAGSELNQAQIAEKLGISRGPVREALGQLEQEGLIHNVPYKGVVITSLTPTYVRELYSLRSALETFAINLAIEHLKTKDLKILKQLVNEMWQAAKAKNEHTLGELDLTFHRTIITMAEHDLLRKTWAPLEIGVKRCLYKRHKIYQSLDEVVGSHPALVDAIEVRDSDQATKILREHILEAGEKICEHMHAETGLKGNA